MQRIGTRAMVRELAGLRGLSPEAEDVRRATERARAAISDAPGPGPGIRMAPLGTLGAALAVAVAIGMWILWPAPSASAAQRLATAAAAMGEIDGWMCVRARTDGTPGEGVVYTDLAGGAIASVYENDGVQMATLMDAGRGECWVYTSKSGVIRLTRPDALAAEEYRRTAERMRTGDGVTAMLKDAGNDVEVRVRADGEADRYDVVARSRRPGVDTGAGEFTIWVSRRTGLIERTHGSPRLGCWGTDATFSYDVPPIRDIYQLGVPRSAPVVDERVAKAPAEPTGPAAVSDRSGLLQIVRGSRAMLRDLTVEWKDRTLVEVPQMGNRSAYRVTSRADRVLIEWRFDWSLAGDEYRFTRMIAFDGVGTGIYHTAVGQRSGAMYLEGRDREADLTQCAFFCINLLCPPQPGRNGATDQSLESLLLSDLSRVRPNLEDVDGRLCHVVDAPGATFWLDAARGCVPLKQSYHPQGNVDRPQMSFLAETVEQVGGFWFVTRGTKAASVSPVPGNPDIESIDPEWVIEVDRNPDGTPAIWVNLGMGDEPFDLQRRLPPGVTMRRIEVGQNRQP